MTVHVLHAGDGYTYLTRQVATGDRQRERGQNIEDYYTAEGAPPGRWEGRGAARLEVAGRQVTEAHMRALFGEGLHPLADEMIVAAIKAGASADKAIDSTRLGRKFPRFANDNPFRDRVERECRQVRHDTGSWPTFAEKLAIEQRLARADLVAAGVAEDPGEEQVRDYIRANRNTHREPVAGYDLVFTPAKSVSVLWGLGGDEVRRAVAAAHAAAVDQTLGWVEDECGVTRRGCAGVEQIDCEGLTVARFDHFDNRAGDPNLHTHCAVSNRVYSTDGKWRALDARVLHRAAVAASEQYNLAVEDELRRRLPGIEFTTVERGAGKRGVREITGIDRGLCERFSRRPSIERRLVELVAEHRRKHGVDPSKAVQYRLAQQATLETREGKAEPRSLSEMRRNWRVAAEAYLGAGGIETMLTAALNTGAEGAVFDADTAHTVAADAVAQVGWDRATWTAFHVTAEVSRRLSAYRFADAEARARAVAATTELALAGHSVTVSPEPAQVPQAMRRANGESVLVQHRARRYTSTRVLDAERAVLDAATEPVAVMSPARAVAQAAAEHAEREGFALNDGQLALAHHFVGAGTLVAAGIGPAGTGKTTAMRVVAAAWTAAGGGGKVVALGPSARAADVLGDELEVTGRTLADVLVRERNGLDCGIDPGDLVLLDEAGMASTFDVAELVGLARRRGAVVRLLGDPQQLAAVESGGLLRDVAEQTSAPELREVRRFDLDSEADATLRLRDGDGDVVQWYLAHSRVTTGLSAGLVETVVDAHRTDLADGVSSLVVATDNTVVRAVNERAHLDHTATLTPADQARTAELSDGLRAVVGDRIVTRRNDRRLRPEGATDRATGSRVRNGDLWRVAAVGDDGSLLATSLEHGGTVVLPVDYVRAHTEMGYACTVHRAQGMTVDRCRVLVSAGMDRQSLYVAASRGRELNQLYVADDELPDVEAERPDPDTPPAVATLRAIIARDGADRSAHRTLSEERDTARALPTLVAEYTAVYDRLVDAYARHLVDGVLPDEVTSGREWKRVRGILAIAGQSGTDPRLLIDRAHSDLDGTWDARAFTDRLLAYARAARDVPTVPLHRGAGIQAPPRLRDGVDVELHQTAQRMLERIDAACAHTAHTAAGTAWEQSIPAAGGGQTADERERLVGRIAVWRTLAGIDPDTAEVLPDTGNTRVRGQLADQLATWRAQVTLGDSPLRSMPDAQLAHERRGHAARHVHLVTDARRARAQLDAHRTGPEQAAVRRRQQRLAEQARRIRAVAGYEQQLAQPLPTEHVVRLRRERDQLARGLPPKLQWQALLAAADNTAELHAQLATADDTDRHNLEAATALVERADAAATASAERIAALDAEIARRATLPAADKAAEDALRQRGHSPAQATVRHCPTPQAPDRAPGVDPGPDAGPEL